MDNNENVSFMVEYLKYALQFEKYVYIWSKAMDEANSQMRYIDDRQRALQQKKFSLSEKRTDFSSDVSLKQTELAKRKKNSLLYKTLALGCVFLSIVIGVVGMYIETGVFTVYSVIGGLLFSVFVFVCSIVGPVLMYCSSSDKKKAKKLKNEIAQLSNVNFVSSYNTNLQIEKRNVEESIQEINNEYIVISSKQEQIFQELNKSKATLAQIYAKNVLPLKYRNMAAVATFYEYLTTRRCNTISGHGGIYDTYEVERLKIEEINQLILMNQHLSNIEDINRCIYSEMQTANQSLSVIKSSLTQIESRVEDISKNTAIMAVSQQQAAASLNWIEWNSYR